MARPRHFAAPGVALAADEPEGINAGHKEVGRLLRKNKLEIAVNDEFVQPTIDAITRGARTEQIGDGKIFVLDVEQALRVRTGETGEDAL